MEQTMSHSKRLSQILAEIFNPEKESSSFGSLVDELDSHAVAIVLILFSIPAALPVPAAGYSTVLSIPLFIIGFRLLAAKDTVWLPASVRNKTFDPKSFQKLLKPMNRLVTALEKISRPRFVSIAESKFMLIALGGMICLLAASMALPIPGTNTAPAFGIFLLGFGLLEKDGLFIFVGMCASVVALCISTFIIVFGYEVVKAVILNFI